MDARQTGRSSGAALMTSAYFQKHLWETTGACGWNNAVSSVQATLLVKVDNRRAKLVSTGAVNGAVAPLPALVSVIKY